jgi:hypothetical protein
MLKKGGKQWVYAAHQFYFEREAISHRSQSDVHAIDRRVRLRGHTLIIPSEKDIFFCAENEKKKTKKSKKL